MTMRRNKQNHQNLLEKVDLVVKDLGKVKDGRGGCWKETLKLYDYRDVNNEQVKRLLENQSQLM